MLFLLLINRQGKTRLSIFYDSTPQREQRDIIKEVSQAVLSRQSKSCNMIEWRDKKIVYKRYASLYFITGIHQEDNELVVLEIIQHFVELLDLYFGNVCELDLIFNFHKAYYILNEFIMAGEIIETNKKSILRFISAQDVIFLRRTLLALTNICVINRVHSNVVSHTIRALASPLFHTHTHELPVKPLTIAVVILTTNDEELNKWLTPLRNLVTQNVISVDAIWSPHVNTSTLVQQVYFPYAITYAGLCTQQQTSGANENFNLCDLLNTPEETVSSILAVDSAETTYYDLMQSCTHHLSCSKNVFSCSVPSWSLLKQSTMMYHYTRGIVEKANGRVWQMANLLNLEPAVSALADILPDLGPLVGASFRRTRSPKPKQTQEDTLLESCVEVCALLSHLFGDISTSSGVNTMPTDTDTLTPGSLCQTGLGYTGWIKLTRGITCSICLTVTKDEILDFTVWGTLGTAFLKWNTKQEYFEVRRSLKNFEHPLLFPSMSHTMSLYTWIEACSQGTRHKRTEPHHSTLRTVVTLTLAHALLSSDSEIVGVLPVVVDAIDTTRTHKESPPETMASQSIAV